MELAEGRKLIITADALKYAKIIASPIENKAQRKRAFASIVALDAFADYMLTQGIEVNIAKNLFKIAPVNEEFEISDVYYNNWKMDIRIMIDDKMVSIPKCHYEYEIPADFYIAIKVDKDLENAEFVGFIDGSKVDKTKNDANKNYFCVSADMLDSFENLISCLQNEKLLEIDEKEHDIFKSSVLAYIDGDLDFKTKKKVVKHLINCAQCRAEFVEFYDFESIVKQSSQFPSVFEDHTLDFIGCTAIENPEYQGKEELIDIRQNEENDSVILDGLFSVEDKKEKSKDDNTSLGAVVPVVAPVPVVGAVPPLVPVKLGTPDVSLDLDGLFDDADSEANNGGDSQDDSKEETSDDDFFAAFDDVKADSLDELNLDEDEDVAQEDETADEEVLDTIDSLDELNLDEDEDIAQEDETADEEASDTIDSLDELNLDEDEDVAQEDETSVEELEDTIDSLDELNLDGDEDIAQEDETSVEEVEDTIDSLDELNLDGDEDIAQEEETSVEEVEDTIDSLDELNLDGDEDIAPEDETSVEEVEDTIDSLDELNLDETDDNTSEEMFSFENFDDNNLGDFQTVLDESDEVISHSENIQANEPETEDLSIDDFEGFSELEDDEFANVKISSDINLDLDEVADEDDLVEDEFKSQNITLNLETEGLEETNSEDFESIDFPSDEDGFEPLEELTELNDSQESTDSFEELDSSPAEETVDGTAEVPAIENANSDENEEEKEKYQAMFVPMDTSSVIKPEFETQEIPQNQETEISSEPVQDDSSISNEDLIEELPELLDSPESEKLDNQVDEEDLSALYSENTEDTTAQETDGAEMMAQINKDGINKKKMIIISSCLAGVLILAGAVGFGIMSKNNKEKAELANQEIFNNVPSSYPTDGTQMPADGQNPQQMNPDALATGASEGTAGPKDMNRSMTNVFNDNPSAVTVTKILWEVSPALAANKTFATYLQQAGKTIQTNLKMDLVNATEFAYNPKLVVRILLTKDNKIKDLAVVNSSGSQQIDDIVLQSIKGTLPYVNVPQFTKADEQRAFKETKSSLVNKDNLYDLKLVINF